MNFSRRGNSTSALDRSIDRSGLRIHYRVDRDVTGEERMEGAAEELPDSRQTESGATQDYIYINKRPSRRFTQSVERKRRSASAGHTRAHVHTHTHIYIYLHNTYSQPHIRAYQVGQNAESRRDRSTRSSVNLRSMIESLGGRRILRILVVL